MDSNQTSSTRPPTSIGLAKAERDLTLGVGILLAIQLITSLVAIALLGRVSPAIERIIEENLFTVQAVEEMLDALAHSSVSKNNDSRQRFNRALQRALLSVSEPEETPLLERIRQRSRAALDGDVQAYHETIMSLRELGEVNRRAVRRADQQAVRLGTAGAWAAAVLGFAGFTASLVALRRLRRRLLLPFSEIRQTLIARAAGDRFRRCSPVGRSEDLGQVMAMINELLDEAEQAQYSRVSHAPHAS
jgi:methyl-accepting chemotaxis protein